MSMKISRFVWLGLLVTASILLILSRLLIVDENRLERFRSSFEKKAEKLRLLEEEKRKQREKATLK